MPPCQRMPSKPATCRRQPFHLPLVASLVASQCKFKAAALMAPTAGGLGGA